MDILDKLSVIKEHSELLSIPFLFIAYCDYFPASSSEGGNIAWFYDLSPSLGIASNLVVAVLAATLFYSLILSGASYFTAYHSIRMFPLLGFIALAMALASQFDIQDLGWIKPSLSFALGTVGFSLLSHGLDTTKSS
ncbi:hypothetical protein BCU90_00610 [Vibrio lentus]|uniref:hypothetical protein n=1 Tax=Vibrio TaxID=662 RepID=UPI000C861C1D|nr:MULTISPECIES: hypothetical protein [Vibrio]NOJ07376.1 hypothetical protein [Vibrio splendidus]PMG49158.1 hypothetical protein BCU90_00610 [Vibrio lentus]PTP67369.1 hypothetical protein CWO31_06890 [Vibrio splendidus]